MSKAKLLNTEIIVTEADGHLGPILAWYMYDIVAGDKSANLIQTIH